MSLPTFPPTPDLTVEDSLIQIFSSIAMEEVALSHILNAEGEKLQYVLGIGVPQGNTPIAPDIETLLTVNESVKDMVSTISLNQMFLLGKLSATMSAYINQASDRIRARDLISPAVDTLLPAATGDTSNWIQIAELTDDMNRALIIRSEPIDLSGTTFANVQDAINNWYTAFVSPELRAAALSNNALREKGKYPATATDLSGFSLPRGTAGATGNNIAFALSYGEAADFCSLDYEYGNPANTQTSPALAQSAFGLLTGAATSNLWLRTPVGTGEAGAIDSGTVTTDAITNTNLVYPAMWIDIGAL
ncbi:MAG: hypothetical protein FWG10_12115 [Eubacteriaceae bacterium]|nr:hypothetical protein [Eubacteriaceae bacterium]